MVAGFGTPQYYYYYASVASHTLGFGTFFSNAVLSFKYSMHIK